MFSYSVSFALLAQIPSEDARNTRVPDTNTHFTMPAYHTRAEWEAHKGKLRDQILFAAGLTPLPERNPLHPVIFGRIERNGYTVDKVYIETLPGYYLCGNLYRPRGRKSKFPGILVAHGHWNYGRLENQVLNSGQTRAANLALQGYVAFSYDMVGYNDTNQTPHDFGGAREAL